VLRPGRREQFTLLEVAGACGCWIGGGGGELVWGGIGEGEGGRGKGEGG